MRSVHQIFSLLQSKKKKHIHTHISLPCRSHSDPFLTRRFSSLYYIFCDEAPPIIERWFPGQNNWVISDVLNNGEPWWVWTICDILFTMDQENYINSKWEQSSYDFDLKADWLLWISNFIYNFLSQAPNQNVDLTHLQTPQRS